MERLGTDREQLAAARVEGCGREPVPIFARHQSHEQEQGGRQGGYRVGTNFQCYRIAVGYIGYICVNESLPLGLCLRYIPKTIWLRGTNLRPNERPQSPGEMHRGKERVTLKPGRYSMTLGEEKAYAARYDTQLHRSREMAWFLCTDHNHGGAQEGGRLIPSVTGSPTYASIMSTKPKLNRKFQALRALKPEREENARHEESGVKKEMLVDTTPYNTSMSKLDSESRTDLYSLVNDRYPGAPGTALAKAEDAEYRARQAKKREETRRKAANAELEHLGVKNLAKRRKSSSPYANGSSAANSDAGSPQASDGEDKAVSTSRSGSRSRRVSSRNSSPMPLTETTNEAAPRWPSHLPHVVTNAPVRPSPLATHAIAANDMTG